MEPDPTFMPLFAEVVRVDRDPAARPPSWSRCRTCCGAASRRRPQTNPVRRFQQRFERDLPAIQDKGLGLLPRLGIRHDPPAGGRLRAGRAESEVAGRQRRPTGLETATAAFDGALQRQQDVHPQGRARHQQRKPFDGAAMFEEIAQAWAGGMNALEATLQNERAGA
jgi:hypothetical protein